MRHIKEQRKNKKEADSLREVLASHGHDFVCSSASALNSMGVDGHIEPARKLHFDTALARTSAMV